jgi:ABC-type multidrug transport system ATPase subunit
MMAVFAAVVPFSEGRATDNDDADAFLCDRPLGGYLTAEEDSASWIGWTTALTKRIHDAHVVDDGDEELEEEEDAGGLVYDLAVDATSARTARRLLRASGILRNGRVCGVLGPSGSGKTTLLSSLLAGSSLASSTPWTVSAATGGVNRTGRIWLYRMAATDAEEEDVSKDDQESTTKGPGKVPIALKSKRSPHPPWRTTRSSGPRRVIVLEALRPSRVAYLQQQDEFFDLLTVRETLELAAFLEIPGVPAELRSDRVQSLLDGLSLAGVASNLVGNPTSSSSAAGAAFASIGAAGNGGDHGRAGGRLSGGERRRLSVALELVTPKSLLVADEPTTGLDSSLSVQVMKLIRNLTVSHRIPAIVSLHQPASRIYNHYLDDCVLLAPGGRVCYSGDANRAVHYFARLGYPCPPATNPAEFLVDLVSVDTENATQATLDRERIERLVSAHEDSHHRGDSSADRSPKHPADLTVVAHSRGFPADGGRGRTSGHRSTSGPGVGLAFRKWGALLRRSWRQNVRNRTANLFRVFASAGNAYLLGLIFPTVRRGPNVRASSVADRVALLSFGAINQCMIAYMKTIDLFSRERPVVRREQVRRQYSALSYLLAKVAGELLLDASFAVIFTSTLKACTGIRISWCNITAVYGLLTAAGASLGFAIGSWADSEQIGNVVGVPIMVILMVVGVINPSGVDPSKPPPKFVQWIKKVSPFACCIEALCLGEYPGMEFAEEDRRGFGWLRRVANLPRMGGLAMVRNGDQVVEALGLKGLTLGGSMKHLGLLVVGNLALSWLGLLYHERRSSPGDRNGNGPAPAASCRGGKYSNEQRRMMNHSPTAHSASRAVRRIRV